MNKLKYAFIFWAAAILSCHAQTADSNTIYNKDFKWTIVIPKDFVSVSTEEWSKVQNKALMPSKRPLGKKLLIRLRQFSSSKTINSIILRLTTNPLTRLQMGII